MNSCPKIKENLRRGIHSFIPQKIINFGKHLLTAVSASIYFNFPSKKLKVIGVTGTDGKTTTVHLIYHILHQAGLRVAMVSTVLAKIGDKEIDTGFHVTTPNPWNLQKFLKMMVDKGIEYAVLEVTSHGLDQFRLWGIDFEIGVLTNVTHEHLDYHKTYENYLSTKAKLLQKAKIAIINKDDESYDLLNSKLKTQNSKLITYGIKNEADFTPKKFDFKTSLPGEYNQYNCLAAIAATSQLGISVEKIKKAILTFKGVVGRMEKIEEGQDFKVIIDFAHTPNALEQVLKFLKSIKSGKSKLIVVFGCAGLRDSDKRPIMGEIACRLADLVVLTAEDPRTEDVNDIFDQIAGGCEGIGGVEGKAYYKIPDRQEAINFAIQKLAKKGDTVVICGKGHEKSMCFGHTEYPWSDQEAAKKALKERRST